MSFRILLCRPPGLVPAWIGVLALLLSACASVPADRGFGAVRQQLGNRGLALPAPTDAGETEAAATAALLAQPLSEAGAVQIAFTHNPRLQLEYARLGLSGADLLTAGRLRNPVLSGSAMFASGDGATRYDLGLTAGLVELLMLPARGRFAAGEFERAKLDATHQLLALAAEVQQAWTTAVGAKQIAAMRKVIAEAASASADLSTRYHAAGNFSALQLAVDQAAASQAQLDLEAAEAESVNAEAALNRLMGLPPEAEWDVPTALPAPVASEDRLDRLQALAQQKNAALDADRRAVTLLEDSLGVTRRFRFLGEVETGVQFERDDDRTRLLGPSLSLQLPIFDQGQAPILRAQARLDEARANLRTRELDTGNDVQLAHDRVRAARRRFERLTTETVPLREAIVARTQEQANFMLVGVFDALRARQEEYAAYQQSLEALRDYWLARGVLARAVGSRLPSDDQIGAAVVMPQSLAAPTSDSHAGHDGMSMPGMSMPMSTGSPSPAPRPRPGAAHSHGDHP